jgi:hypothetical protein
MPEGKMEAAYGQMTAMNDWEAKEFFLSRISEQAKKENIQISDIENQMLKIRFGDPSCLAYPELAKRIKKEIKRADFERKISWLIKGRYEDDISENNAARDVYKRAFKALKSDDYFLHAVVDKAIGRDINKVGLFLGDYPTARGFKLKIFFWGMLFIFGLGIFFDDGKISIQQLRENKKYIIPFILLCIVLIMEVLGYIRFKKDDYFTNKAKKK